jgi:O-methyltransferase
MMKAAAVRVLDAVGLGAPARQIAHQLPKIASRLRDVGVVPWKPLVPEAAFGACVRNALQELRRREPAEAMGDYLEFGVSRGTSMACVFRVLQEQAPPRVRLIGFDSFEGMPPEAAGQGWRPGEFRSTLAATRRYLAARQVDLDRVALVKGWFKDTLTPETRARLAIGKASLIMVDCDIYTASKEALEFCAPHIHEHAVIVFDDWGREDEPRDVGQKEAFEEFLSEHPVLGAEPLPAYIPEARVFLVSRRPSAGAAPPSA